MHKILSDVTAVRLCPGRTRTNMSGHALNLFCFLVAMSKPYYNTVMYIKI